MINRHFDEFIGYFCTDINGVILLRFFTFCNHQPEKQVCSPATDIFYV